MNDQNDWQDKSWAAALSTLETHLTESLPTDPDALDQLRLYLLDGVRELSRRWETIGPQLETIEERFIRE